MIYSTPTELTSRTVPETYTNRARALSFTAARSFRPTVRDVPVDPGTTWGDVRSVGITHHAAGPDFAADNWTMDIIVISSVSDTGDIQEQFSQSGAPVWPFRKNENQVWQHDFA